MAHKQLDLAYFVCQKRSPYFATPLYRFIQVPTPGLTEKAGGPIACDEYGRLYYDDAIISQWTPEGLATGLEHEIGHGMLNHADRGRALQSDPMHTHQINNILGDAEIGHLLVQNHGRECPIPHILPPHLPSMFGCPDVRLDDNDLYEVWWNLIKQHAPKSPAMKISCGSAADGDKKEWELGPPTPENPGISKTEQEIIRLDVAKQILQQGNAPSGLKRWAHSIMSPVVPWERELRSIIQHNFNHVSAGIYDYTYTRRPRRGGIDRSVIQPGYYNPLPNITEVVDTSGSMNDDALNRCKAETDGILKCFNIPINVCTGDTQVETAQTLSSTKDMKFGGGGGTSMRTCVLRALELYPQTNILILMTDCATDWPTEVEVEDVKFIVCAVGVAAEHTSIPSYARAVFTN